MTGQPTTAQSPTCPECGESINYHDGLGGPNGCTLTDNGVAQRLAKAREAAEDGT